MTRQHDRSNTPRDAVWASSSRVESRDNALWGRDSKRVNALKRGNALWGGGRRGFLLSDPA